MAAVRALSIVLFVLVAVASPRAADVDRYGDPLPEGAVARCGTVRFRFDVAQLWAQHWALPVVSPDGRLLAAHATKGVEIWGAQDGRVLRRWNTAADVFWLAWSPDGKTLAAKEPRAVTLWDSATGRQLARFARRGDSGSYNSLVFSHDGNLLAAQDNAEGVIAWDIATRERLFTTRERLFTKIGDGFDFAFTRDSKSLVLEAADSVSVWDVAKRKRISDIPGGWRQLRLGKLAPGGRLGAAFSDDGRGVDLWNLTAATKLRTVMVDGKPCQAMAFSPDDKLLAWSWRRGRDEIDVAVFDVETGKVLHRFPITNQFVQWTQLVADGRILLTVSVEAVVRLWDCATGRQLNAVPAHENSVATLAFTADGATLVSGGADGTTRVWNPATGEPLRTLPGHRDGVNHVAFLPDGQSYLSCGVDDRLRLNDFAAGRELRRFDLQLGPEAANPSVPHQVITLALSPDGRTACSYAHSDGRDRAVYHLWDVATGKPLARHSFPRQPNFLAFSPDARQVLEYVAPRNYRGSAPVPLVLRDLATLRPRLTLNPPEETEFVQAFSPDGQTLAAVTTRQVPKTENESDIASTIRLWEIATGRERQTLAVDAGGDFSRVERLAFSPDGRSLAVVRDNRQIQIWDVLTGRRRWQRGGFTASVQSLAFSPDGRRLATGHGDSTILVWDVTLPATAVRTPTAAELDADWQTLSADDAKAAWAAMARLAASPAAAVALCRDRLKPAEPVPAERIKALLAELDSPKYSAREAAFRELAALGESAEPLLNAALTKNPSAELKQRLDRLLAPPRVVTAPEALRRLRAVQVLSWIGTAEAREVLRHLATGDPADRATTAARDAVLRMSP
ncbi:MAG: WD40 repeat domain-containing protein [Gemmataceae bacterium]